MARRLLPLTVLTGIFAALGTGFLVPLFGRDSFAAVLIMLAWICTLCFVIYLLILAVILFIRALTHLLREEANDEWRFRRERLLGRSPGRFPCGRP